MEMRSKKQESRLFRVTIVVVSCMLTFTLIAIPSHSASFDIPEKFVYDLTWTGIKAGTASLEITNDGSKVKITSTARSAKWVSFFYTVDDRIESTLVKNEKSPISSHICKEGKTGSPGESFFIGKPLNYRLRVREGRHRRDKEILFDLSRGKATYIDYLGNEKKEVDVPRSVLDPVSSLYYVRTLNLVVGEPAFVTIFDSKRVWNIEVQVLRREKVSLPIGTFDAIVIKPLMKSEGIFYRKGDIFIWLTDDMKRIPIKLQTRVAVGYVTATLVRGNY
jgi:Protein of unknown function (DUF3108)